MAVTMTPDSFTNAYYGLSTDNKPTDNVPNASTFYEFDTTELYMYDATNGVWRKQ